MSLHNDKKKAFATDANSYTENLIDISTICLLFETYCNDIYWFLLSRGHHDLYLFRIHYKTCESNFADVPFTLVFSSIKNNNTGIFSKTINPKRYFSTNSESIRTFSWTELQVAKGFLN